MYLGTHGNEERIAGASGWGCHPPDGQGQDAVGLYYSPILAILAPVAYLFWS